MITLSPAHLVSIKADLAKFTVRLTIDIMLTPEVLDSQDVLADFANGNVPLSLTMMRRSGQMSLFQTPAPRAGGTILPQRTAATGEPDEESADMTILPTRTAATDEHGGDQQ